MSSKFNINTRRALADGCFGVLLLLTLLLYTTEGLNLEGQYLLELKNNLHDKFNHLGNWKSTDENPCGWVGVNCSSDYNAVVQSLNLNSMNLSGTLNASIGRLTHLTYLNLAYNGLMGNIPKEIGNCSSLEYLYLHNNNFEGQVPAELGKLSLLKGLNICNNRLSSTVPDEVGNLS